MAWWNGKSNEEDSNEQGSKDGAHGNGLTDSTQSFFRGIDEHYDNAYEAARDQRKENEEQERIDNSPLPFLDHTRKP